MSLFPKIQSPCPYKGKFSDIMQGNECRLCKREVVDITDMSVAERKDFLASCETEVCISYKVGAKSALAAMAMGAAAVPTAAAAQDDTDPENTVEYVEDHGDYGVIIVGGMRKPQEAKWLEAVEVVTAKDPQFEDKADANDDPQVITIVAGGMRKPQDAEFVDAEEAVAVSDKPELPVVYDDEETPDSPETPAS